jgi:hypothetical protein
MLELKLFSTSEVLPIESFSLNYSIDNWVADATFSIANETTLNKLTPAAGENYVKVEFTLGAESWLLLCEKPSADETGFSYSVSARSVSALLAEPHAEKITQTWSATTAQTIANELSDSVDWQVLDWDIASYSADKILPVDIIKYFSDDIDARLQTEPDGTLSVVYYPPCSPYKIEEQTPDYELNNCFEISWDWVNSSNDKTVLVTTETDSSENSDNLGIDSEQDGADLILKIRTSPFNPAVTLSHRSTGFVELFFEGELTEQVEEIITVQDGKANLSKNYDSLVSATWQQDITGNLTYSANGDIVCDNQSTGFVKVVYMTRYQQYRAVKLANIERTGFEAVSDTSELTGGGLSLTCQIDGGGQEAEPVVVKTLNSIETLLKRGSAYLWKNATDFKEYSLETPYAGTALKCGKIARVNNEFNGWITAVSISGADSQTVTVLRPVF